MIVRDEEHSLGGVLADAAEFCDELVVVDTGSTDATVDVAKAAGARVEHFEWIHDFAAARNYSFDAVTGDWIIWLDADDRVVPEVRAALREAKVDALTDDIDVILTPYRRAFSPVTGECVWSLHRERLIRRKARLRWEGVVHEAIPYPAGRYIQRDDLYIDHRPEPGREEQKTSRNLFILERAVEAGDSDPRTLFYFANELRDAERYSEALDVYRKYVPVSLLEWEKHAAYVSMARCARELEDPAAASRYAARAVVLDPSRAEGHMSLAQTEYDAERWERAAPLYAAAAAARRPSVGFIDDATYSWRAWDFLSVCLANAGRHEEAIQAALKSLRGGNPDPERIHTNISWSLKQM